MLDTRLVLTGLWVALMLTYLLGDVLRIFAGDFKAGEIEGVQATQAMWFVAALIMLVPIVMVVLTLTVVHPAMRWVTIIAAVGLFLFNLVSIRGYPGNYDKFLIAVGLVWNAITVWYAWNWDIPS